MKKNLIVILATVVILVLVFWLCIGRKQTISRETIIKIGYSAYSVNLPLFVAVDEGLFLEQGLNAHLIPFQSTDQMATALEQGQLDIASALTAESVYSINSKSPDKIRPFFFNIFLSDSSVDAIIVPKDSKISQIGDLEGKKVGILPVNMMQVALRNLLGKFQIDLENVILVVLPPASILSALSTKEVDACYILEPLITIASTKLDAKIIETGIGAKGIVDPLPAGFHCLNSKFLGRNPNIAAKLITIYKQGANKAKSRHIAQSALANYCSLKQDIAEAVALPVWSEWTPELQNSLFIQFNALRPIQAWDESSFDRTLYVTEN